MQTLEIFVDPLSLFSRVNKRPNWLVPFFIVALIAILCVPLSLPIIRHLVLLQMPEGAGPELQEQLLSSMKFSMYYGLIGTPVVILLKWSILAFSLFTILILSGADTSFRKTLSVLAHASIITTLDGLLNLCVTYARGISSIQSPDDMQTTVLSLNTFLNTRGSPVLHVVLDSLSVFSIWYFALLVLGVMATTRFNKTRSAFAVFMIWILQTGFLVGTTLLFSRYGASTT